MRYNLPERNPYNHPGRLYIKRFGIPTEEEDLAKYADFLRKEARAGKYPPIRLRAIHWRFGIRLIFETLLPGTPGFTDHENGVICVDRNDSASRQRFTQSHELIEILYGACRESPQWEGSIFARKARQKERLCHKGAASLLMPRQAFLSYLSDMHLSLQTASSLAKSFKTSFTAAVHRMVALSPKQCAMVVWHDRTHNDEGADEVDETKYSLQVWWAESSADMGYIQDGAISDGSLIQKAFDTGEFQSGSERLRLGDLTGFFSVEATRVTFGSVVCVLTLIQPLARDSA